MPIPNATTTESSLRSTYFFTTCLLSSRCAIRGYPREANRFQVACAKGGRYALTASVPQTCLLLFLVASSHLSTSLCTPFLTPLWVSLLMDNMNDRWRRIILAT